MSTNQKSIDN